MTAIPDPRDERTAFEAWCFEAGLMAKSNGIKSVSSVCDTAWLAWQARASLPARTAGEAVAWALQFSGESRLNLSTVFDTEQEAKDYAERCVAAIPVPLALAAPQAPEQSAQRAEVPSGKRSEAYDLIDRFLRNNLDDADFADYSEALDLIYTTPPSQASPEAAEPAWTYDKNGSGKWEQAAPQSAAVEPARMGEQPKHADIYAALRAAGLSLVKTVHGLHVTKLIEGEASATPEASAPAAEPTHDWQETARVQSAKLDMALDKPGAADRLRGAMGRLQSEAWDEGYKASTADSKALDAAVRYAEQNDQMQYKLPATTKNPYPQAAPVEPAPEQWDAAIDAASKAAEGGKP